MRQSVEGSALDAVERVRRLVERSPDAILIVRQERIVFSNPAAARLFGAASSSELLNKALVELVSVQSRAQIAEPLPLCLTHGAGPAMDATLTRLDGTMVDVDVAAAPLGDDELQVIVRDITERKRAENALRESEERLTLAFAGAQEGVWDWNLETGAVVYSPRWKQMLGYADEEIEPTVTAWERLIHPDDLGRAREVNESVMQGGRNYEMEVRLRHKQGHYIDVLSRGYPVRISPAGPVTRIVGTHLDLTDRKRMDRERSRTEMLARLVFAQEDERRRISREMHDQFGAQLTVLTHHIGALKEVCRNHPELQSEIKALEAVAERLDRDVDQLVWELRPTVLDDLGLRVALTNYVQEWSKRVGIRAELHTSGLADDRLPFEVETTLYRIVQEAMTNIAKHSGAENVDVILVILERRPDCFLLIVEDDGIGFDTGAQHDSGHSFGLLGMRERAAMIGATLQIESSLGRGTTVLLRTATSAGHAIEPTTR